MLNFRWMAISLITLLLLFFSGCVPSEGAKKGFDWTIVIFLLLIFAVFYFLILRPQRKRQKEQEQLMQELQPGDKVITAGGIYGEIESISEDSIILKVESGATLRVAKGSVAGKREK